MIFSVFYGSVDTSIEDFTQAFAKGIKGGNLGPKEAIIFKIRTPRVLMAALVGAALSLSGLVFQSLMKNPLADGSTLGVSSAASLGAILAIGLGLQTDTLIPFRSILAMAFAFTALVLILSLASKIDPNLSNNTVILLGIIFSMFISSLSSITMVAFENKLENMYFWSLGSLSGHSYGTLGLMTFLVILCGLIILSKSQELNAFSMGEDMAHNLGLDIFKEKMILYFISSTLVGFSVSFTGNIAFVGLVIPHISRLIVGPDHKKLIPIACLIGGTFLMLMDLISRTIFAPREIPIGVVTSFVGAVFFVSVFYRSKKYA